MHLKDESDITLLALPAILNKQLCVNNWVIPGSINKPKSLAHKDVILHASFMTDERKSDNCISNKL